jgi:hypothetical protein
MVVSTILSNSGKNKVASLVPSVSAPVERVVGGGGC